MSNGNGHSWSKLVWKDWKNEPTLRACSWAARGMWMDLLCLAHEGLPIGHITLNGRPPTLDELASMLGGKVREVEKLLAELETKGVFSRTTDGTIYSRRMVRDAAISVEGAKHAAKRNYHHNPGGGPNGSSNGGGYGSPSGEPKGDPNAKSTESRKEKENLSSFLKQDSVSPPAREEAPSEAAVRAARQQSAAEVSAMPPAIAEAVRLAAGHIRNYALDGQAARQTVNEQREDVAISTRPKPAYLSREQLQAARRQQLRVVA